MKTNSILAAALQYLKQGIPVIPADPKTKRPLITWAEYQKRLPTEQEVKDMWKQFPMAMVCMVTGKISDIAVIDCDSEEAIKKIEAAIPDSMETIVAVSPRGGRHYYFKCNNGLKTQTKVIDNVDIRAEGGVVIAPPSRNATGGQYSWLTCLDFNKNLLQDIPGTLLAIINYNNNNNYYISINKNAKAVPNHDIFCKGSRDADLFELAKTLRKAGKPPEYILQVLKIIILNLGDEFDEKKCLEKINSTFKHEKEEEKSLSDDVREWVLSTDVHNPVFLSTDVHRELDLSTRVHKKNCSEILRRLVEEGIIERHGERRGVFRRVNKNIEYMDFVNVSTEKYPLNLPLGLNEYVNIEPKSIIVIAGTTNAGKTTFMLNTVKLNDGLCYYFNSEMSAARFRNRIDCFGLPIEFWQKRIKLVDQSKGNYADLIQPNAVNYIDYLELNAEKTYLVANMIRGIYDKLDKGIAIIGIQKAVGARTPRGGDFALEKAQLAISLEYDNNNHIINAEILKAKSQKKEGFNINHCVAEYKLTNNWTNFMMLSNWRQK